MKNKMKWLRILMYIGIFVGTVILIALFFPTWTTKIAKEDSISELKQIKINGTDHEVMIRGTNKNNPIVLFVHGGPGFSEIPYATKYQDLLEDHFTIVRYDQRASGKSYHFTEDYSNLSAELLVEDLLALTDYISDRFGQEKIILSGHSYGTYLATQAAFKAPEKYEAYIGIGQMSDTAQSELNSLNYMIEDAKSLDNQEDLEYLQELMPSIKSGKTFVPRDYISKYRGDARKIDPGADYNRGFWLGSEYNLLDTIRFNKGAALSQEKLINQTLVEPLPKLVTRLDMPFYFIMGKHDYMTTAYAAKNYFEQISSEAEKKFIVYEDSAHYPQFEDNKKFSKWMVETFAK